ncbi:MarR family winged helix-turn-helix transcriptional regulator [Umezawaea tangerina]|uniref:MarR family transcriptional regulator n=1 Tax=Umezawaea tangerina TaxID=84725 RepID=A0A2T0STJ9_9PSEU|nr:winged helix DNA-binding protein [Umezawaea tangerina]PRY36683.1 MarR family transcriptional regulator [Umezawaea tangerina]
MAVLLRDGFRWFVDRLNDEAVAAGEVRVSPSAGLVISYLRPGGIRSADLARLMGMSRQHLHAVLRELIGAGVVTIDPDPTSGRDRLVNTTAAGEIRRLRALDTLARVESDLAATIGEPAVRTLRETLDQAWGRQSKPAP